MPLTEILPKMTDRLYICKGMIFKIFNKWYDTEPNRPAPKPPVWPHLCMLTIGTAQRPTVLNFEKAILPGGTESMQSNIACFQSLQILSLMLLHPIKQNFTHCSLNFVLQTSASPELCHLLSSLCSSTHLTPEPAAPVGGLPLPTLYAY